MNEAIKRAIQVLEDNPKLGLACGTDPDDPNFEMVSVRRFTPIIPIPLINATGALWPVWRPQVIEAGPRNREHIGKEAHLYIQPLFKHIPELPLTSFQDPHDASHGDRDEKGYP